MIGFFLNELNHSLHSISSLILFLSKIIKLDYSKLSRQASSCIWKVKVWFSVLCHITWMISELFSLSLSRTTESNNNYSYYDFYRICCSNLFFPLRWVPKHSWFQLCLAKLTFIFSECVCMFVHTHKLLVLFMSQKNVD